MTSGCLDWIVATVGVLCRVDWLVAALAQELQALGAVAAVVEDPA